MLSMVPLRVCPIEGWGVRVPECSCAHVQMQSNSPVSVFENTCPIVPVCGLKAPLHAALQSFLSTLDQYTLADAVQTATHKRFAKFLLPT